MDESSIILIHSVGKGPWEPTPSSTTDFCGGEWIHGIRDYAVEELKARGLRAGLASVASQCEVNDMSSSLQELAADEFEIINHSMNHEEITSTEFQ